MYVSEYFVIYLYTYKLALPEPPKATVPLVLTRKGSLFPTTRFFWFFENHGFSLSCF